VRSPTKKETKKKKSTLRRLVVANLVALLGLITATVVMLFALGLLDSIFAFFF
jgi:hypothetical protein